MDPLYEQLYSENFPIDRIEEEAEFIRARTADDAFEKDAQLYPLL